MHYEEPVNIPTWIRIAGGRSGVSSPRGSVPKRRVKIKLLGPVFRGFSPEIRPLDPLRSTGHPPDINLHQKSAPETNSEAISLWAHKGWVCFRTHPHGSVPKRKRGGVKMKVFGPVFVGFNQEIDPGTPLDRPGTPRTSICSKNQPVTGHPPDTNLHPTGPSSGWSLHPTVTDRAAGIIVDVFP